MLLSTQLLAGTVRLSERKLLARVMEVSLKECAARTGKAGLAEASLLLHRPTTPQHTFCMTGRGTAVILELSRQKIEGFGLRNFIRRLISPSLSPWQSQAPARILPPWSGHIPPATASQWVRLHSKRDLPMTNSISSSLKQRTSACPPCQVWLLMEACTAVKGYPMYDTFLSSSNSLYTV